MHLIKIKSNIHDYDVIFLPTKDFLSQINKDYPNAYYVVDSNVWKLYKSSLKDLKTENVVVLPINEKRKCLKTVLELYDSLIKRQAKRNIALVSIGGGILQDITGFVASTLYRGINWIFIPTTLLAQADSCIGSKTSLNYKGFKNLIGTFYPPNKVFIDTSFLKTQEDYDFYSGVGEVVKLHIMGGKEDILKIIEFFPEIKNRSDDKLFQAVYHSLLIKQSYIEDDEFDTGRRNLLNYGHCFGHALETASNFEIPHGQAVVLGMILANIVSRKRGLLSYELEDFILKRALLPSLNKMPKRSFLQPDGIISAMKKDKKRTGEGLALIMMVDDYKMIRVNDVSPQEVSFALEELMRMLIHE